MNDATFAPCLGRKLHRTALKLFFLLTIATSFRAAANQNVILAWDPSEGALSYNVYYGVESGHYTETLSTSETSVVISNLVDGVTYYFAVTAVDAFGIESLPSEEIYYTVPRTVRADSAVLSMRQTRAGGDATIFAIEASDAVSSQWTLQASPDLLTWNAVSTGTNSASNITVVVVKSSSMVFRLNTAAPGVFLSYQIAPVDPLPNSFFLTTTAAIPAAWTVEASTVAQTWFPVASGDNSPVNIAVLDSAAPKMFFRLKGD